MPFQLDAQGWPLHPQGRTGRTGRNLGKWGENAAADPVVVAGTGRDRRLLLITRDDILEEATPGGMVDPGETAPQALVRELREETGVDLADHRPVILGKGIVDDWRNTDRAWGLSFRGRAHSHAAPGTAIEVMDRQRWCTVAALSAQSQFTGEYCFFSAVRSRP